MNKNNDWSKQVYDFLDEDDDSLYEDGRQFTKMRREVDEERLRKESKFKNRRNKRREKRMGRWEE